MQAYEQLACSGLQRNLLPHLLALIRSDGKAATI
jgi:hypothetical protein